MKPAYDTFRATAGQRSTPVRGLDGGGISPGTPQKPPPAAHPRLAPGAGARTRKAARLGKARKLKHLAVFTRQLYILVASGSPLVDAIAALERQTKDGVWQGVLSGIRRQVEEGKSLSEAMAAEPECFDAVHRSLIAAGESSGQLAPMLDRLAGLARRRLHLRNSILGAVIYPSLLLGTAVGVMVLLLTFVIPRFQRLFETLGTPLPATTKALIDLSDFLRSYWWGVLGVVAAGGFAVRMWLVSPAGRRALHASVLRLPYLGGIVQNFITAWIARMLGILLDGRVAVLEALRLTRQSVGNVHYAELVGRAEEAVTRGEPLSAAFADPRLISPSFCEAVRNGEQSGRLGHTLTNVADFMDEDNEVIVRSLTSILEPVILIVLGLLVGLVAVSLFTPLFDLTSMTQGGKP